jgi:DNA-binding HxlR family transcriptional regulator
MAVLGEPWTMLIVRDLFNGMRRFDELVEHLGVARNVLSRRLAKLIDAGMVAREEYHDPGQRRRQKYRLTEAGLALRPVLLALMSFGDGQFAGTEGPPALVEHTGCGATVRLTETCTGGHTLADGDRLRLVPGPGARPHAGQR